MLGARAFGLARLTRGHGPLGEAEHVGAHRVVGQASALVGWQFAIRVNLSFESAHERLASWASAGASVVRATP
jgi:hypothetical protein